MSIDYFLDRKECELSDSKKTVTNPRYKNFTQTHFTAGDEEQFFSFIDRSNNLNEKDTEIDVNIDQFIWEKYENLSPLAVNNTFMYIFHKFKKGIYIRIKDNKLITFLPFSKANYTNEWSHKMCIDPKFKTVNNMLEYIAKKEGYKFKPNSVNVNYDEWYSNNGLIRWEYPLSEGDTNVPNMRNMLIELCEQRSVPDIEFFINRRDFPIIKRDSTEPYDNIWDSDTHPLVSHNYDKYSPILSMCNSNKYADILMPTWEDWARVQNAEGKWFPKTLRMYSDTFDTKWSDKIPVAIFRGGTTGIGTTINTNMRLKLAYLSSISKTGNFDAGITNWNLRIRKIKGEKYLQTIDIDKLPFKLANKLSPYEQSKYKYIINVDGHVSAFRLSLELSMGSVILLVNSEWKLWYSHLLSPYVHYVPLKHDLSDIDEQINWCKNNDDKCKQISENALYFFNTFLCKKSILDFMQKTLFGLKKKIGNYNYPITPLYRQIKTQEKFVNKYTFIHDNYTEFFSNKTSVIGTCTSFGIPCVLKTTQSEHKYSEYIHEAFIGIKCINKLLFHIPNFCCILGFKKIGNNMMILSNKITGMTLLEYINSSDFNFHDYLFILIQLSLALQVAQNLYAFVHNDLSTWNIIIKRLTKPKEISYIISHDKVVTIKTKIIPVIIDYGKSFVIYKGKSFGFINMYNPTSSQDILSILIITISQLIDNKKLSPHDFSNLLRLSNFISNTQYRKEKFNNAKSISIFYKKAKKYSELVYGNKYELTTKTPKDLINYILLNLDYKFDFTISASFTSKQTLKIDHTVNIPNRLLLYFYFQRLNDYTKLDSFNEYMKTLPNTYDNIIIDLPTQYLDYKEETFLDVDKIRNLKAMTHNKPNVSCYKYILDSIFVYEGAFKLLDSDRVLYKKIFEKLFNISPFNLYTLYANNNTLRNYKV